MQQTSIPWEVIVVDNNSTDNTQQVAAQTWQLHTTAVPLQVVTETKPGLVYARKKGYATARYDLLLYCDDDNSLQPDYLQQAFHIMQQQPQTGLLGGQSVAVSTVSLPWWFAQFDYAYAVGKQLPQSGLANQRNYVTGAGVVIRRQVFDKLYAAGFEPILTGRKGNTIASGEDSEICLLAKMLGYDLYYDERLFYEHHLAASRLNWPYCSKMIAQGFAIPQLYFYMYSYCFGEIANNRKPLFEYAHKRNLRKPFKELLKDVGSIKGFVRSILFLLKQQEGSAEQLRFKARINKLRFALTHKALLRQDFERICKLLYAITGKQPA
jgi:glycosyltransferase involved in cell wall biosynthesis